MFTVEVDLDFETEEQADDFLMLLGRIDADDTMLELRAVNRPATATVAIPRDWRAV